jgi:type-F conjugative transfer system pilin assembly protein TrbC
LEEEKLLRPLNNLLILLYLCGFCESALADTQPINSCQISKKSCSDKNVSFENEILKLADDSIKKVETIRNDTEFQTLVGELQNRLTISPLQSRDKLIPGELYIFVSFSMGERALLNLAKEAKEYGATLILRGFKERSYKKTALALQKIIEKTGQGFLIDPELYTLFNIISVPTYVLTKSLLPSAEIRTSTPTHDRLNGHVSIRYALETFAKSGNFQEDANLILKKSEAK